MLPPLRDTALLLFENVPPESKPQPPSFDDQSFGQQFQLRTPSPPSEGFSLNGRGNQFRTPSPLRASTSLTPIAPPQKFQVVARRTPESEALLKDLLAPSLQESSDNAHPRCAAPRPPPRPPPKPRWLREKKGDTNTPASPAFETKKPAKLLDAPVVCEVRVPVELVLADRDAERCIYGLLRPGVDQQCLLRHAGLIQAFWRRWRHERQIDSAKNQLEGRRAKAIPAGREAPIEAKEATSANSAGFPLPKDDPTVIWDEALAYRQPSVEQVVEAQRRWLEQQVHDSGNSIQQAQLDVLLGEPVSKMVKAMTKLERRLQLRARTSPCESGWRPPCAVGASVCKEIEVAIADWQRTLKDEASGRVQIGPILRPCVCLFEFVVACSFISRNQLASAQRVLNCIEEAAVTALPGTFLHATVSQLRARAMLHMARVELLNCGFEDATSKAQQALALFEDRRGPRLWSLHCWELAACYRTAALGFAGTGHTKEAIKALDEVSPLLAPPAMMQTQYRLVRALQEDTQILQLECRVALHVDMTSDQDPNIPEALQTLSGEVTELLAGFSGHYALACANAIAAKLALLKEIPWASAGSARLEVLDAVTERTMMARNGIRGVGTAAVTQKVMPMEVACLAMRGDLAIASDSAQLWARNCQGWFGEDALITRTAWQFVDGLKAQSENSSPSSRSQQFLSRTLRKVLGITGVGACEPSRRIGKP